MPFFKPSVPASLRVLLPGMVVVFALGCGHGNAPSGRVVGDRLPRVEVSSPQRTTILRKIELAATVEPLQRVELNARVPGTVAHLPPEMDIGKRVKKGEILCHLAVPDLQAEKRQKEAMLQQVRKQVVQSEQARLVAHQEVEEARQQEKKFIADHEFQQKRYERVMGLVKMGAQDKQVGEEAQRQLEAAAAARSAAAATVATRQVKAQASDADLEVAKRKVEVADAEVQKLTELITFATIKAPFDGVITRRWVDAGATIKDAGAPLFTVMQLERVRVLIDIPQREVPLVNTAEDRSEPADTVILHFPALSEVVPNGEFKGAITRLSKALDPVTRTMRGEVEIDNSRLHLRPGMYGRAEVLLDERSNALTIPATAMVKGAKGKPAVYVVTDPRGMPPRGKLKLVELELGLDDGRKVEVRKGLQGDELIVNRGNGVLREGDEVIALSPVEE